MGKTGEELGMMGEELGMMSGKMGMMGEEVGITGGITVKYKDKLLNLVFVEIPAIRITD